MLRLFSLLFSSALIVALALLAGAPATDTASAAGPLAWGPRAARGGERAVILSPGCPSTPDFSFSVPDPAGDDFGFGTPGHDITGMSVVGDAATFCLTMDFGGPVTPADTGGPNDLVGVVEFDTDEDPATGFFPYVDSFCPDRGGIGVEVALDLWTVSGGMATMFPSGNLVPVTFGATSLTAEIPVAEFGDAAFNFASVVGTLAEPTDCIPNGGSTHSPDGSFVPAPPLPDTDGDGVPDIFDNCPLTPNPLQEDSDFDFIGDACDPVPFHDLAITRLRASGASMRLATVSNAVISVNLTVRNLYNHPEEFYANVFLDGLPAGCGVTGGGGYTNGTVRRLGQTSLQVKLNVTCSPSLASPGTYPLTVGAYIEHGCCESEIDYSNNFATTEAVLRIR